MKTDIAVSGVLGLLIAAGIYLAASSSVARLPILVQNRIGVVMVFVFLLLLAVFEMPMMLFALRQLGRAGSTPRLLVIATFTAYVAFASVYAAIFVLMTAQVGLGLVLIALSLARFATGVLIG